MSWISAGNLLASSVAVSSKVQPVSTFGRYGTTPAQLVKKPSGLYSRNGAPDTFESSSFWPYYDGWVINSAAGVPGACVSWAELQPNGLGTALDTSVIDAAVAHARAMKTANPAVNWTCILRVLGGIWAPAWAKNLDGPALVSLAGGSPFQVAGKGAPGVIATGGSVSSLTLHSVPTITSGSYVAAVDVTGRTATFQLTQDAPSTGGYVTVTATGTDVWNWATSTTPLSGASGATADAAIAALPERVQNSVNLAGFTKGGPTTIGRWWTPNYLGALRDLYTRLAAAVDTTPEIVMVTDTAAMTTFGEPCLKNNWDSPADSQQLMNTGWNLAAEANLQRYMYDFLPTVFRNTSISKSLNPYEKLSTSVNGWVNSIADTVGVSGGVPDPEFANNTDLITYAMVTAPAANPSLQRNSILLENNSLAGTTATAEALYPSGSVVPVYSGDAWTPSFGTFTDARGASYTTLYTAMARYGAGDARQRIGGGPSPGYRFPGSHLHFQTATGAAMGGVTNLPRTLAYAAWLGGGSVETLGLSSSGMSVTGGDSSQVAFYRNAIKANA